MTALEILRFCIHYGMHFVAPALIAWLFFRSEWRRAYLIMLATMLVDVDHLLAHPIFDPNRCSIGFHPLHSYFAIIIYVQMLGVRRLRIVAVGLLFHMLTDFQDCFWM